MKNEKGISLVTLIVTIIIVVILALIGGFYSRDILDDTETMNMENDLRNVDELVGIQKARIMSGEVTIPSSYLADEDTINSFGNVDESKLDSGSISKILSSGKYYYMDQTAFNQVFGESVNVKNVKGFYLINFDDKVIIRKVGNKIIMSGIVK